MRDLRQAYAAFKSRVDSARNWDAGHAIPPPERAKHRFLARLAQERGNRVFIESGTYFGDTTAYMLPLCDLLVTIELDDALYAAAARRFAGDERVRVLHGDGAELVPQLVREAPSPPLVWLDGHYSGGETAHGAVAEPATRILGELVGAPSGTTIVIDDLRLFGRGGWPTLAELVDAAHAVAKNVRTGPDNLVVRV